MRGLLVVVLLCATTRVHADGVYFEQMFGIGQSDSPLVGKTIQTRAGIGARVANLALETWVASDSAPEREGAVFGLVGGEPTMGTDLASYGVSLRTILPLHRTAKSRLEGYTRIGAGLVEASGRLEGYKGNTLLVGGGFQITGQVRALGFLWGPLFFLNRGPRITGALFADYGYERMDLARAGRELRIKSNHLVMGFAIGSAF